MTLRCFLFGGCSMKKVWSWSHFLIEVLLIFELLDPAMTKLLYYLTRRYPPIQSFFYRMRSLCREAFHPFSNRPCRHAILSRKLCEWRLILTMIGQNLVAKRFVIGLTSSHRKNRFRMAASKHSEPIPNRLLLERQNGRRSFVAVAFFKKFIGNVSNGGISHWSQFFSLRHGASNG